MPANCDLPSGVIDQLRRNPIHTVLHDLGQAAYEANILASPDFRKLIAYLLESADGRDRREPWVTKPGQARPVPKLRVAIEKAFGVYADLQWFRLNKTTNSSGMPLIGLFPRAAASLSRVSAEDFAELVEALISPSPDSSLLRLLHKRSGQIKGVRLELFSRLAFAFRRDLYFAIPNSWASTFGFDRYIEDDLRKYCFLCRTLRSICNDVQISEDIRGSVFARALAQEVVDPALQETLYKALAPTMAQLTVLEPGEAYEPSSKHDDQLAMPLDFAVRAIRARRGEKKLRNALLRAYDNECAISGPCPKDLLEVAYVVAFPSGNVHSMSNTLLLRSDLHTLWDLHHLAVDPVEGRVHVADALSGSSYTSLADMRLRDRVDGTKVSMEALKERWERFTNRPAPDAQPSARPARKPRRHGDTDTKHEAPIIETERPRVLDTARTE